ncbi:MAG: PhoH family protein [Gemmatimonadetes bacterium]|nr:PhoH family protein [Gemmatimonadota bacterium]
MDSATIEHRLTTEGADYLLLAGVNDGNLHELARLSGCRVVLRGDHLILSGPLAGVERLAPVAEHLIRQARMSRPIGIEDIRRAFDAAVTPVASGNGAPHRTESEIVFAGLRRLISAKSDGQRAYIEAMSENDIVVAIGPAGTGKTYLAVAAAIDALRKNRVKRIVLARPAVEAGENLGFLPGDLQEKVDPYLRPLYDALDDIMPADWVRRSIESRTIEIAPLAYMRGRTLSDALVILDEAQNATRAQMKMFLTRLGLNSRVIVTGDKTQIDLPHREDSGLLQVERILQGIEGIRIIYLDETDVVRHRLVTNIIRAYQEELAE